MRILALDPGGTVGYALFEGDRIYRSGQFPAVATWDSLQMYNFTTAPLDLLVVETFVYRRLPKVDLTPVEIIGIIKEWSRQRGLSITWQSPSQAKHFFTDEDLKRRKLYKPAHPHANDAMRHLLYYLTFNAKVIGIEKS